MSRVDEVLERINYANNALVTGEDMTNVLLSQISVSLAYIVDALNADCKTEPTGYNLSPVDKDINVRSKDEPQTLDDIGRQIQDAYDKGLLSDAGAVQAWYEAVKNEQTDCPWK